MFTAVAHVLWHESRGRRWVVDGDIEACFDSLDHPRLLRHVAKLGDRRVTELVSAWLAVGTGGAEGRDRGVVQGAPLSPLLANVYLHAFDVALLKRGFAPVRYADDFVIMCRTRAEAAAALDEAEAALHGIGLSLNRGKTAIVPFGPNFTFLGAEFCAGEEEAG